MAKKYLKITRFGTRFGGAWGTLLRPGANDTHKPYVAELQILSSLCMQKHVFVTAVNAAAADLLRKRVG